MVQILLMSRKNHSKIPVSIANSGAMCEELITPLDPFLYQSAIFILNSKNICLTGIRSNGWYMLIYAPYTHIQFSICLYGPVLLSLKFF